MLAGEALQRAHDELEIRVKERTAELVNTNELLQAEILERKRVEETLKQSETRFRTLIEESPPGISISRGGIALYANQSYLHIFGYDNASEVVGTPLLNRIAPNCRQEVDDRIRKREGGEVMSPSHETIGQRKDGSLFPIHVEVANIHLQDGPAMITFITDITERKRAEEALQKAHDELELRVQERTSELEEANKKILKRTSKLEETNVQLEAAVEEQKRTEKALRSSETSYRGLAESIGEVFYAMDKDLRYIYWNNASEKLTGISAEDAIGKSLFEIFPELKGSKAEKLYREVLKTQRPKRFVSKYQVNSKNLFFEINAYYSKFGISIIAKDITERKHAEDQIYEQAALLDKAQDAIALRDLEPIRKVL